MSLSSSPPGADSSDDIAADITTAIAEQRLPPGTKLREEALARLYSVSRTKIRAALVMLAKDKLIDLVPDKGAFVSRPTEEEARQIFFVRRVLEAALVREFVAKASAADYATLEQHLQQEREALSKENPQIRSRLLSDFHILLAQIVGNQVLTEVLTKLAGRSSLITMLYQSTRDATCSSNEHAEFIEAAKTGDTERAVELMMHHLHHVESALQFEIPPQGNKKDFVKALLA
ncbi:GntR family transcriptional regulator [Collimonas humicola]|uniref:GntR family transcriptional regulator n=1 Tax=Collimonas humicola TaxID=2825886 RepID=UPI001B8C6C48|nr:GntR family transcriptional regulator [Collimonas humicola]